MNATCPKLLMTLIVLFLFHHCLHAQMPTHPLITWDEFLQEYATEQAFGEDESEENQNGMSQSEIDFLEMLTSHPLQLNKATRDDFLQIPFLEKAQIDSLLSFRAQKHSFYSLGDLLLIKGFDYQTRRWLSLFVRCDSLTPPNPHQYATPLRQRMKQDGSHEVLTLLEVPLYKRKGYQHPEHPTASNYFLGNPLRHLVRYRYHLKKELNWGFLMEKDAGEPVGKQGFYPYDHLSAYLSYRPFGKNWQLIVGDFEVRNGRGLLFGLPLFSGTNQLYTRQRANIGPSIRPHTSAAEYGFHRGGAFSYQLQRITLLAFASFNQLDARIENDTIRTILQTGLHRTFNEIERRHSTNCISEGLSINYEKASWGIGLHAVGSHYANIIWPEEHYYNGYVFRGKNAGTISSTYSWHRTHWGMQGELAVDHNGNIATEHLIGYNRGRKSQINLQIRHFSPSFVSIYGKAIQQGSNVRNEQGILLAGCIRPTRIWEFKSSIDLFRYIKPTFTSIQPHAKGLEFLIQANRSLPNNGLLQVQYKLKTRQYTVTQHKVMEYRTTQRLGLITSVQTNKTEFTTLLHATLANRQTSKAKCGLLIGERLSTQVGKHWQMKWLAAWFKTSDYSSAIYLRTPEIMQTAMSTAFMYHGAYLNSTLRYNGGKHLGIGLQCASRCYFDRKAQSSGLMEINSPWKSDVHVILSYKF